MPVSSSVRLETPQRCVWCGRPFDASAEPLRGRVRCPGCGVATTTPWPTAEELSAAYGDWYRPPSGRFLGIGDAMLRRTRALLAHRLDRIAPTGPVLDVGTGDGTLLDALAARGRKALGLERETTRPDVRVAELHEVGGRWAAIVFWHSLEHLPNPGETLEYAAALLAPEGVLVIAAPNADSLQARLFRDRWFALDLPRHLVHLPAAALITRLRALQLDVQRVSFFRGGQVVFGWLHGMVAMLPGHPDLWDAIRRPEARRDQHPTWVEIVTLGAAALLAPLAVIAAAVEVAIGRGGTVYIEARRV